MEANRYHTKLETEVLQMHGMSGIKYRIFINNLAHILDSVNYLEIGSWRGSTACSIANTNNNVKCTCIDNWSNFGDVSEIFKENINKNISLDRLTIIEKDFREVDYSKLGKFNIYLFDGPHYEQDQYDALALTEPCLEDEFIFIVDDWNVDEVRKGTFGAIEKMEYKINYSLEIRTCDGEKVKYPPVHLENSDWHNGYFISIISKS